MTKRRMIVPEGLENIVERFRYAPGILIGNTLYCSGQVGRDEDLILIEEPEAQFEQCFQNLDKILTAAGFTFADVVEMETWFTHFPDDLKFFRDVKNRWITGPIFPTWTALGVASLSTPGMRLEIRIKAIRDPVD